MKKYNLGCCDRPFPGFIGIDIAPGPHVDMVMDLSVYPWPLDTGSASEIIAFDLLEHLPDRIKTWNELHRVLAPGGIARIEVPNAAKGAGFYQDPQHVSAYCLNSFQYIQHGSFAHKRLAKSYGITAAFRILELGETKYQDTHEEVWKIKAVLECVK